MKIRAHGKTDRGLVRIQNEDSLLIDPQCHAYAVADGLGGRPAGALASQTAVGAIDDEVRSEGCEVFDDVQSVVAHANQAVLATAEKVGKVGMATTLTLVHLKDSVLTVAHVGDSMATLVRDGRSEVLTHDHTVENERRDIFGLADYSVGYRDALTRSLGQAGPLEADVTVRPVMAGDCVVLATDGLSELVSIQEIAATCEAEPWPELCCEKLVRLALERGGPDNVSVIVIFVDEV